MSVEAMGTTFRISLLMTFLQTTQSHIQVSTFNPGNIPLNSAVDFQPVAQLENVHSKIQCVGACVLRGGCVAIVLTERCCKMYDQMASMTNWTPHNQSVYLELKSGKFVTMQASDTLELTSDNVESATSTILQSTQNYESTARNADLETTEYVLETTDAPTTAQIMESTLETTATMTTESEKAFPANLNCPQTRSCTSLSADAAFIHINQSYVVTKDKNYYSFDSIESMCSGFPYQSGLFSELMQFPDAPDMLASAGATLFVFENKYVTTYRHKQGKYQLINPTEPITAIFPTILTDSGSCFLAHNSTHGILFDTDKIFVDSLEFKQDEEFHSSTGVPNPFFNFLPSGTPHACTQTSEEGFVLFLDNDDISVYDTATKTNTNLGKLCYEPK